MLKMELAEVVNPHFAVPVFGVVLCAVLVFAFGFKSSVQPPSFDFDEEKRLRRRKGKKSQTNGHIPSQSVAVVTVAKQQVSATKSSAKAKSEESLQAKLRTKKAAASPKAAPAKHDVAKATEPVEDVDGWTTAISKKVKKRRNKEQPEDVSKYDLQDVELSGGEARTDDVQEAMPTSGEAESPKGQRKRKEKKQKPVKEVTTTENVCETSAKIVTEAPKTVSAKMDIETPERDVSQDVKVEPEEEKPTEVMTPEEETSHAEVIIPDEPPKRSPKKIRSKKDKIAAAPEIEEPKPVGSTEGLAAKDDVPDKKSKKSPKKKKKGTSQDVSETLETPSVNDVESSHISTSHIADVSSSKAVKETVSQGAAHDDSNQPESGERSNSPAESVSNPQPSSSPVTFDELGADDWQEAKPQKKKKKTRREN
ncbi:neurofilament heavy polypeptide-like [Lineus longissimus]|uniref:neurofilament heavy polypeptide-like n=1 Tax=Lineus longissimus TaxID=88925 RepID=UPI002B4D0D87